MADHDRQRWDLRYASQTVTALAHPDAWLIDALQIVGSKQPDAAVPRRAIDLACGLGHNAIWLAQQGWQTEAVDISPLGLEIAKKIAAQSGVVVGWVEADLDTWLPTPDVYDLMVIFRYLDRRSIPQIVRSALRPGGWLVYETFSRAQCQRPDNLLSNPAFTLAPGELPALFAEFDVVEHQELDLPDRTVARLLARRPVSSRRSSRSIRGTVG